MWERAADLHHSCCGLMHVGKYPVVNALASLPAPGPLQVLRRRPRKLVIEEAKADPDRELGLKDSAVICGGPPGTSALDF